MQERLGMDSGSRASQFGRAGLAFGPIGAAGGWVLGNFLDRRGANQLQESGQQGLDSLNSDLAAGIWGRGIDGPNGDAWGPGTAPGTPSLPGIPGVGIPLMSSTPPGPDGSGLYPDFSHYADPAQFDGMPAPARAPNHGSGAGNGLSGGTYQGGNSWGGGTQGAILSNLGMASGVQEYGGTGASPTSLNNLELTTMGGVPLTLLR
jgi:hypothetical protein